MATSNFPPTYDYPKFLAADGSRLHPGEYFMRRGGENENYHPLLRAGQIWKVVEASPNTRVLELAALNHPEHRVPVDHSIADAVVLVNLSPYFIFEAYKEQYLRFEARGWFLWVENDHFPKSVRMRAYNPRLNRQADQSFNIDDSVHLPDDIFFDEFYRAIDEDQVGEFLRVEHKLPLRAENIQLREKPVARRDGMYFERILKWEEPEIAAPNKLNNPLYPKMERQSRILGDFSERWVRP
ncbi:hypothetical protein CDA63_11675 [Hymenobacter amundsenii]|uniref:Uncharacterized protein n=1 Tax=Hymenobacter amundsenii TaxID=2006685 RepID=A0A246FJY5_9BACT|nr:hypothetical protein [Hymenobacter amundsenii]OWP62870.1 hypothetical protein CDA63_11675 [Hymenobacter amundsenii]